MCQRREVRCTGSVSLSRQGVLLSYILNEQHSSSLLASLGPQGGMTNALIDRNK